MNLEPHALIFAGPNGSGKSTLTAKVRQGDFPGILIPDAYINADEIALALRASGATDPERDALLKATFCGFTKVRGSTVARWSGSERTTLV